MQHRRALTRARRHGTRAAVALGILASLVLGVATGPVDATEPETDERAAAAEAGPRAAEPKGTDSSSSSGTPAEPGKPTEGEILAAENPEPRIVGGTVAPVGAYPFFVSVQTSGGSHFCGGSMISSDRAITAAHCVDGGTTPGSIRVVVGRSTLSDASQGHVSNVTAITVHPSWNPSTRVNDVAILRLTTPIPVTSTNPSNLRWVRLAAAGDPFAPGNSLRVIGHGQTCGLCSGSNDLLQVDLPVRSDADSQAIWGSSFDPATMIGAGPNGGAQGGCFGDSGGPLFVNGALQPAQVGDVSWGSTNCDSTTNFGELPAPSLRDFVNANVSRPSNDNFPGSTIAGADGSVFGSNTDAVGQVGEPSTAASAADTTVWYTWTAPASGPATFNLRDAAFDTVLSVWTGSTLGSLTKVVENDDYGGTAQSKVSFNATSGTTYRIQVDGFSARWGAFGLQWAVNPPANDDFVNATTLSGEAGKAFGTNVRSTGEPGEPAHASTPDRTVWYRWTAPESGPVVVNSRDSSFDTTLAAYTGSSIGSLTQLAANDDSGGTVQSRIAFNAVAGTVYRIAVDGFGGSTGSITLQWAVNRPGNDDFASARLVTGDFGSSSASTNRATGEPGEPPFHGGAASDNSVWFQWTPAASAPARIRLHNTTFSSGVEVYTGSALNSLATVAEGATEAAFNAVAGTTYRIAVDGNGGSTGTFLFEWVLGRCDGLNATIMGSGVISGTAGDDVIVGSTLVDTITAGAGNDRICGLSSNDSLSGEGGNDRIFGGAGGDTISGGAGNDAEFGEDGDDRFNQGSAANGSDLLEGGPGKDRAHYDQRSANLNVTLDLTANDGAAGEADNVRTERVFTGSGNDTVVGDADANQIDGGGGADNLRGGAGKDILIGGAGGDSLFGEGADDALNLVDGVNGNDFGDGGPGNDTASADPGDTVVNVP